MKVKCEYCGAVIDDQLDHCPNCGAENKNIRRTTDHTPKTIEELQQWYADRKLPPYETTRFFIGQNYTGKKAFGIYREGDEVIVYKNKADGTRAIRYQGTDEAYGVNELYLKLKSEILNQKANQGKKKGKKVDGKTVGFGCLGVFLSFVGIFIFSFISIVLMAKPLLTIAAIALPIAVWVLLAKAFPNIRSKTTKKVATVAFMVYLLLAFIGLTIYAIKCTTPVYYHYNDQVYVYYDNDYYEYYDGDYSPIDVDTVPAEVLDNGADYEFNADDIEWDSSYSFKDSDYYIDNLEPDDYSSDDDYDWDSGSDWDSGGTDWGSDW